MTDGGRKDATRTSRPLSDEEKLSRATQQKGPFSSAARGAPGPFPQQKRHLWNIFAEQFRNVMLCLHRRVGWQRWFGMVGAAGDLQSPPCAIHSMQTQCWQRLTDPGTNTKGHWHLWVLGTDAGTMSDQGYAQRTLSLSLACTPLCPTSKFSRERSQTPDSCHCEARVRHFPTVVGLYLELKEALEVWLRSRACPGGPDDIWLDSPGTWWDKQRSCLQHTDPAEHSPCGPHLHRPITPFSIWLWGLVETRPLRRHIIASLPCPCLRCVCLPTPHGFLMPPVVVSTITSTCKDFPASTLDRFCVQAVYT